MNVTVTAVLKVPHNLVRTGMYWFWESEARFPYYYFKICRGPDRTSKRAASGPRAVVCPSLL